MIATNQSILSSVDAVVLEFRVTFRQRRKSAESEKSFFNPSTGVVKVITHQVLPTRRKPWQHVDRLLAYKNYILPCHQKEEQVQPLPNCSRDFRARLKHMLVRPHKMICWIRLTQPWAANQKDGIILINKTDGTELANRCQETSTPRVVTFAFRRQKT